MTQVHCSHPVRQDIMKYDISFNSVMARGRLLVPTALQRRLDLIETRCVEEVTELLELAQQLLLCPDALKKFRDQEYMICGKRYVWLDWILLWEFMRYEDIYIYIYIYIYICIWWYIFLFFGCDTSATGNSWMHVRWFRPFRRLATPKVLTATNWKKCWAWIRMLRSLPALLCRWGSLEMATRSEDELFLEVLLLVRC